MHDNIEVREMCNGCKSVLFGNYGVPEGDHIPSLKRHRKNWKNIIIISIIMILLYICYVFMLFVAHLYHFYSMSA